MKSDDIDEEQMRARLLNRLRGYLARRRSPRAILSGIMLATAVAGFLASLGLLKLGIAQMWMRYPLAVLVAWGVFLLLVRRWAESERASMRLEEELAAMEAANENGTLERKSVWPDAAPESHLDRWYYGFRLLDILGVDAEGCLVVGGLIAILALVISAVAAIGGLFLGAETLLAEVLLDTVLVSAFYHRLRRKDTEWWMHSALRQTVWPVLTTMACLIVAGIFLHYYAPEAHSIGAVWRHWRR